MSDKTALSSLAVLALAVLAPSGLGQCELDKLTASDAAAGDGFGWAVSVFGDKALIGANQDDDPGLDSGSAYVFEKQGTLWVERARLTASDSAANDVFGNSVSLSGDIALVGAHGDDDAGLDSGSAYVFEEHGPVWVETAKLTASDGAAGDSFGYSVSLSGETGLVGAFGDNAPFSNTGSAYVFEKQGTLWVETAKLTASDAAANDHFGFSVSISGVTALVGARLDDDAGTSSGSAYVFEKQGTLWVETAKLTASDAAAGDLFGRSVSISGDTAVVGASGDDDVGPGSGSAYVFEKQGSVWVETAKLNGSDAVAGALFGFSTSISGETALVGSFSDGSVGLSSMAYVFEKLGSVWVETAKFSASDAAVSDGFVSLSGDTALVGAGGDDDAGADSGSVYAFWLGICLSGPNPGIVAASNTLTVSDATPNALVGLSLGLGVGVTHVGPTCPGLGVDIENAVLVGVAIADGSGSAVIAGFVPASLSGKTIYLQAVDVAACEVSHLVSHTFP